MDKLHTLIRATLGLDAQYELTEESKMKDIPGWDSMKVVNLEIALEETYGLASGQLTLTDNMTIAQLRAQLPA